MVGKNGAVLKGMTRTQFNNRAEEVRERLLVAAEKLGVTVGKMKDAFYPGSRKQERISREDFKRKLVRLGFSLTDFPDEDLAVLDADSDGTIT